MIGLGLKIQNAIVLETSEIRVCCRRYNRAQQILKIQPEQPQY